jgi:hypothetical protein
MEELLRAVDLLEDALYDGGIPQMGSPPATDAGVGDVVRAADAWAKAVRRAYGSGERQRRRKGAGILPFFDAGSGFDADEENPVALIGEVPHEFVGDKRVAEDLYFFEYAFSHSGEPHLASDLSLRDPTKRGIAFTLANWDEVRKRLRTGYGRIVKRSLGLSNWIRGKVQELEAGVVPRVREVGAGSHNRVQVEVSHMGTTRMLELTYMQAEFLGSLAREGTHTAQRRTKMDLLNRIPELRPWIENRPRDSDADVANEASYGVAPEAQKLIWSGE